MPRRLRYIPRQGTLVEITCRIIHGRKLLRPCRAINEMIVGTLARAKREYGVRVCAVAYMSNHAHLLLVVDDAKQLADFMRLVNSKIAREIGRRRRWREKIWGGRYSLVIVSEEPEAQIARLRYILSQGVKEHLVARCVQWPGAHAAASLMSGRALIGRWLDRSAKYRARRKGQRCGSHTFAKSESLVFDPLPCWAHLSRPDYRERVRAQVQDIENVAAADRRCKGIKPLGVKAILRQDPKRQPKMLDRSPAPAVHAARRQVRLAMMDAYRWFETAYREAAALLRAGYRQASFPHGCFPPPLPFVEMA